MNVKLKKPAGLARSTIAEIAMALAISTFADEIPWNPTWDRYMTIPPVKAEGVMEGLDAKARGFGGSAGDTQVDKWYWDVEYSNAGDVDSTPAGMMIIVR